MSIATRLAQERRARLAAERLLELKQAELMAANRKLDAHARALTHRVEETQAENEQVKSDLTAANEQVQIAEQRLWLSLHTIQDGFAFFNSSGVLISANPSYLSVFDGIEDVVPGISYDRILRLLTDEGIIDTQGEPAAEWRARMMRRWRSHTPAPEVLRLWNNQYIRIVDRRGPSGDMVTLAMNITDSVRSEKRLRAAQRRAEAANRAKSAFLANMSHEIRTPMNGVIGIADLLAGTEMTEEQELYVDTIRNSGEALLVIINDVLDYSKIEADRLVLQMAPFDLERVIHEVVVLLQPTAREKGIDLLVDCDLFTPSSFLGDAGRVRQVLTNLVGNAVKFTEKGQVMVRAVGLPDGDDATAVHLTVEDTGIGIPKEQLTNIFGEFNQVDGSRNRKYEGTGLGLAISKRLIEMMNGDVWVDSEPGVGSCFGLRVTLPHVAGETEGPLEKPDWLNAALVTGPPSAGREALCTQLRGLGIQTATCDTAHDTVEAAHTGFDVLLIEDPLPEMTCLALAEKLREAGNKVPIVVVSDDPNRLSANAAARWVQSVLPRSAPQRLLLSELAKSGAQAAVSAPIMFTHKAAPGPRSSSEHARLTVLVAEDNKTNQFVFQKMVTDCDLDLTFANNGVEAVEAYERLSPDIVFMDISMPIMDGKEATARIRGLPGGAQVPIIAVTAHAMSGDREDILAQGLTDYLTKPLRKQALIDMLEQHHPRQDSRGPDKDRRVGR